MLHTQQCCLSNTIESFCMCLWAKQHEPSTGVPRQVPPPSEHTLHSCQRLPSPRSGHWQVLQEVQTWVAPQLLAGHRLHQNYFVLVSLPQLPDPERAACRCSQTPAVVNVLAEEYCRKVLSGKAAGPTFLSSQISTSRLAARLAFSSPCFRRCFTARGRIR